MSGFDRLMKMFGDDFRFGDSFIDCALIYLNKKIPEYTWSKYTGECNGENYIMSAQNDKLIRRHQIDFEDGWKTRLANFLENEVLLEKLNIILD